MTEIPKTTEEPIHQLPASVEDFILQWGDLGSMWGVNRSIAQIHALLFATAKDMNAEEIATALGMARSNVSNSIKELLAWDLISRVPRRGDRRDYYRAEGDLWEVAMRIASGRKTREIDPLRAVLSRCADAANDDRAVPEVTRSRLREMNDFVRDLSDWYDDIARLPKGTIPALVRLGSKVARVLKLRRNPSET